MQLNKKERVKAAFLDDAKKHADAIMSVISVNSIQNDEFYNFDVKVNTTDTFSKVGSLSKYQF